jgi:hypothetical protein
LKTFILRKNFTQKVTELSEGHKVLVAPASIIDVFPGVIHVFLQHYRIGLFAKTELFSILKSMISRKYFFQKLHHFSQGNNVLDAANSNIDGFHWRDTCVSSTHLNKTTWSK